MKNIRTEEQMNRKIAYDCGEKIAGARKELAARKKAFLLSMSVEDLKRVEEMSTEEAQAIVTKKQIWPFDMKNEKEKGRSYLMAFGIKMLYDRISPKAEDGISRSDYLQAILRLKEWTESIQTRDEMMDCFSKLRRHLELEGPKPWILLAAERNVRTAKKEYEWALENPEDFSEALLNEYGSVSAVINSYKTRIEEAEAALEEALKEQKQALQNPFLALGYRFATTFLDNNSYKAFRNKFLYENGNWNKWEAAVKKKADKKNKSTNSTKEKWTRVLPEYFERIGGREIQIKRPEDLLVIFGLRGAQFGKWVEDNSGGFHLKNTAEALADLADILAIQDEQISCGKVLGIAFGARGKGKAAAHYEPTLKVINLTKEGGMGALAHEMAHFLDNCLYEFSLGERTTGYASENPLGAKLPSSVQEAIDAVIDAISKGDAVKTVPNENKRWSFTGKFRQMYKLLEGNVAKTIAFFEKEYLEEKERLEKRLMERQDELNPAILKKRLKKIQRDCTKNIKKVQQVIAYIHEQETGEKLKDIPIATGKTYFLIEAEELDKGRKEPYWSKPREMFARAFESWVQDKLNQQGRRNDYLVTGTKAIIGQPYPRGEERKKINEAMDRMVCILQEYFFSQFKTKEKNATTKMRPKEVITQSIGTGSSTPIEERFMMESNGQLYLF
ncbi:LPD1 domain-containing protein [Aneurinibacillus thermoaerophilus]|uniref:LPD1 domain-containing protein n=1 Tax=Aneurinibacillus thermoaerophilus TaxID=143495 RepID=UPI002E21D654|nr:hypothetical protein [Aneurinibacillus thermoaerophilus]